MPIMLLYISFSVKNYLFPLKNYIKEEFSFHLLGFTLLRRQRLQDYFVVVMPVMRLHHTAIVHFYCS